MGSLCCLFVDWNYRLLRLFCCCRRFRWRPARVTSSSRFNIIIRQKSVSTCNYLTPPPFFLSSTAFALETSNRRIFSLHAIFISFMSVAGRHETFMTPFHTLISCDIPFVLFRLKFEHDMSRCILLRGSVHVVAPVYFN